MIPFIVFLLLGILNYSFGDPTPASKGEFPWLVNIQTNADNTSVLFCNGIIISERWVLTSARCFSRFIFKGHEPIFNIFAGDYDLTVKESEQRKLVLQIVEHPKFNSKGWAKIPDSKKWSQWCVNYKYDFALLGVSSKFKFSATVNKVKLSTDHIQLSGNMTGVGWTFGMVDLTKNTGHRIGETVSAPLTNASVPMKTEYEVIMDTNCTHSKHYGSQGKDNITFCAVGDADSAIGSGLVQIEGHTHTLYGVLNARTKCDSAESDFVYFGSVAVYEVTEWIKDTIERKPPNLSCCRTGSVVIVAAAYLFVWGHPCC